MQRVLVVVEGPTERAVFQQSDVAAEFQRHGIWLLPKVVGKPGHKGGVRGFDAVKREIIALLKQEPRSKVSTFFDFYGLPRSSWPGHPRTTSLPPSEAVELIERAMSESVAQALPGLNPGQFVPYLQLFELESLLFADPEAMAKHFGNAGFVSALEQIVASAGGCELINDAPETAPSKRIRKIFPGYRKGASSLSHAPLILGEIARTNWSGLRSACPRFSSWLTRLEPGRPSPTS